VKRTEQDLLAERRALVNEQRFERDQCARAMLQFRLDQIDRELHERNWRPSDQFEADMENPPAPTPALVDLFRKVQS
jgi:hypothetical protein